MNWNEDNICRIPYISEIKFFCDLFQAPVSGDDRRADWWLAGSEPARFSIVPTDREPEQAYFFGLLSKMELNLARFNCFCAMQ